VPSPHVAQSAEKEARALLESWLEHPRLKSARGPRDFGVDLIVEDGSVRMAVEVKRSSDSAAVAAAIQAATEGASRLGPKVLPVVAVPYMGDVGKKLCAAAGVSWFDLSGNAHIVAPRLRILIDGKPNLFIRRGRPSTAFAPKSSRVARRLLLDPKKAWRQQDLARATHLDDGFTSRIVQRLEHDRLLERGSDGLLRVRDADRLLDAWGEAYDFEKHTVLRGHVTARDGEELLAKAADVLEARVHYAATGLAAAYLYTQFAAFRLASFYIEERPPASLLKDLGFREEARGANVWLVVPNDEGVFDGAETISKAAQCVHPVQAYVDLKRHPERSQEAAAELRSRLLKWTK
jgi:hypothetical protein